MTLELLLRFVLGGTIVSVFAVAGEIFKPKTFAGMFGAAPSVALASLGLAYSRNGADYVAAESGPMMLGGIALLAYTGACIAGVRRKHWPVWLAAGLSWGTWFLVAFALLKLALWKSVT